MNGRERYRRAIAFAGPDRPPVMHRTLPGAFRHYGRDLDELYARYPSDVLFNPASRNWFGFNTVVGEGSGRLTSCPTSAVVN